MIAVQEIQYAVFLDNVQDSGSVFTRPHAIMFATMIASRRRQAELNESSFLKSFS